MVAGADQLVHLEQVGRDVEDQVVFAEHEVVHRGRPFERQAAPIEDLVVRRDAVDAERRLPRREGDAEVEELAARGNDVGVGRQRADRVEPAAEGVFAAAFEGDADRAPREALLAESEQLAGPAVDADVERRLETDAAFQPVAREGGAESAVEGPPGLLFVPPFAAAHEAVHEADASPPAGAEVQGGDHAVAVEPVAVADLAAGEAARSVEVIEPRRKAGSRSLGRDLVVAFGRQEIEEPLEARGRDPSSRLLLAGRSAAFCRQRRHLHGVGPSACRCGSCRCRAHSRGPWPWSWSGSWSRGGSAKLPSSAGRAADGICRARWDRDSSASTLRIAVVLLPAPAQGFGIGLELVEVEAFGKGAAGLDARLVEHHRGHVAADEAGHLLEIRQLLVHHPLGFVDADADLVEGLSALARVVISMKSM